MGRRWNDTDTANWCSWIKTCQGASLSATYPIYTDLGLNLQLCIQRLANCLSSHGVVLLNYREAYSDYSKHICLFADYFSRRAYWYILSESRDMLLPSSGWTARGHIPQYTARAVHIAQCTDTDMTLSAVQSACNLRCPIPCLRSEAHRLLLNFSVR